MGQSDPVRLMLSEVSNKGRPLAIHLAVAGLRVLEDYRTVLGNIDRITTVAAVASAVTDPAGREVPSRRCSIKTVAELTESDKETARRRVLRLAEDGVLLRDRERYVSLSPAFVRTPTFLDLMRSHAAAASRLANAFCSRGLLEGYEEGCSSCLEPTPTLSGAVAWKAGLVLLSSMHRGFQAYRTVSGTTDDVLILLAVIAITSQHLIREDLPDVLEDLQTPIPRDRLGVCNISSIAAAAGLPFETTRRKTAELIKRGSLVRDTAGNIQFTPGILQQPMVYDMITRNAVGTVALVNRLERLGVLVRTIGTRCGT